MMAGLQRLLDRRRTGIGDAGFTLIEMLVAMVIAAALGGVILTALLSGQRSAKITTAEQNLNQEARVALNRMAGDLSQATPLTPVGGGTTIPAITAVQNPDGDDFDASAVTSVTFNADFNGDGCVAGVASQNISQAVATTCTATSPAVDTTNPDTETICWDPASEQLYLVPGAVDVGTCEPAAAGADAQPLLSGKISAFTLGYQSSLYRYDSDHNGITTWSELDAAGPPVGNANQALDMPELQYVNSVAISLQMTQDGRTQSYSTKADLRNVS